MKTIHSSPLAARCAAFNAVNAEANRLSALTIAALTPFVGKKVLKADGSLTAAVKAVLPPAAPDVQKWLAHSNYSLCFALKTYETTADRNNRPGEDYRIAHYAEVYFYAGEVKDGVLIKLSDPINLPTDHNPEKVAELRKIAEAAKEAARQAESACGPFGLYDR
jgi:hypothetical protein